MKNKILIFIILHFFSLQCFSQIVINSSDELIAMAIDNSKSLNLNRQISLLKMKSSELALTPFLPQLDLTWQEYDKINRLQSDQRIKSISANITQLLYDNGNSKINYLNNRQSALTEYLSIERNFQLFKLQILEMYYKYIFTTNSLNLKQELLINTEKELKVLEYKYQNGLTLESDLIEYEICCKNIRDEIDNLKYQQELILIKLKIILDIPVEQEIKIQDTEIDFEEINTDSFSDYRTLAQKLNANDIELQQLISQLEYSKNLYEQASKHYIPNIYLSAGCSFSGQTYPLTQPDYSLKLIFNFDAIPFAKSSVSNQTTNNEYSSSLTNNITTQITPETNYFQNKKISKLQIQQIENSIIEKEKSIQETAIEYINSCNNLIRTINTQESTNELYRRRNIVLKYQADNGLITQADYIHRKIQQNQLEQEILNLKSQLYFLIEKIKIISGEEK